MKKRYGQHFISDRNILQRIVRLANIQPEDTVIEIGPGAGSLTRQLASVSKQVIAVEIDRDLIHSLQEGVPSNVRVVEGDALLTDFAQLASGPFHIVGNLPYNVGTPLIRRFIEYRSRILDVTIMLQKEVAERIRATPDSADYGPLSILVQYYASPVWGFVVSPGAFTPRPKVDSAVIRLEWKPNVPDSHEFTDFVHKAFASRRKKLINNLASALPSRSRDELMAVLAAEGIREDARPETLSIQEFLRVYNRIRTS